MYIYLQFTIKFIENNKISIRLTYVGGLYAYIGNMFQEALEGYMWMSIFAVYLSIF